MYNTSMKSGSVGKERRLKFKFQDVTHAQTIQRTVNELREAGFLLNMKAELKYWVLTEDKLDEISAGIEHPLWKSLRCLAQEMEFQNNQCKLPQDSETI